MDKQQPFLKDIHSKVSKLTSNQKRLVDLFQQDPSILAFEPAVSIGRRVGVSEATVHRLAIKLGFSSFSDMQKHTQQDFVQNRTVKRLQRMSQEAPSKMDLMQDVFATDILNMENTLSLNQPEDVWEGARLIANAKRIYVAGWRAGLFVTAGLSYTLNLMLGNTTFLPMHSGLQEEMRFMQEGDVIIATGLPRYCDVTLGVVEYAHKQGITTMCITDAISSPFVPYSTIAYFVSTYSAGFLDSYTSAVALANSLTIAVSHLRREDISQNLKLLESIMFPLDDNHFPKA